MKIGTLFYTCARCGGDAKVPRNRQQNICGCRRIFRRNCAV